MQQRGEANPGSKEKLPAGDSEEGLWGGILHLLCLLTSQVWGWEKGLVSSVSEHGQRSHFCAFSWAAQRAHFLLLQMGLRMNSVGTKGEKGDGLNFLTVLLGA